MDPQQCREFVAEAIRKRARKRGLSLRAVAELAGVNVSYMERVVTCKSAPTIDWIAKVSMVLECNPRDLLP